jgi:hypothetical protein
MSRLPFFAACLLFCSQSSILAGETPSGTVRLSPVKTQGGPMIQVACQSMSFQAPYLTGTWRSYTYVARPQNDELVFTFTDKNGKQLTENLKELTVKRPWRSMPLDPPSQPPIAVPAR